MGEGAAAVTVLVPLKAGDAGKSRLAVPGALRSALVRAMAEDVLGAVADAGLIVDLVGDGPDLDAALTRAAASVPGPVVVVMADLPCLRPDDLGALLDLARGHPRWCVADAEGSGTALLGALNGPALRPSYGPGSRRRHAADAVDLTSSAAPGLRRDVDTLADLALAAELGLGPRTAAVHLGLP